MKNGVFWDVEPCGSCVNRRFGGTWMQTPAATCSRWFPRVDFCTLKMEAIRASETSVHTRSTRCHIPEDAILQGLQWSPTLFDLNLWRFACRNRIGRVELKQKFDKFRQRHCSQSSVIILLLVSGILQMSRASHRGRVPVRKQISQVYINNNVLPSCSWVKRINSLSL
jgi:hypothetical protein